MEAVIPEVSLSATLRQLKISLPASSLPGDGELQLVLDGESRTMEVSRTGETVYLETTLEEPAKDYFATRRLLELRSPGAAQPFFSRPIWNSKKRPRVLVMIPAGEITEGRDDVSWVDLSRERIIDRYVNIGDMVVYDSTLKMLEFSEVAVAYISDPTSDLIAEYNEDYDYCFLRGSNFIRNDMDWLRGLDLIERLRIPVVPIGVGAQAVTDEPIILDNYQKSFWKAVSERCNSIGLRGTYSAATLEANDVRNLTIVGCPSVYRERNPGLQIRKPALESLHKLAFNIRREVGPDYSSDPEHYLRLQRQAIVALSRRFDLTLTAHGETEEKIFFYNEQSRIAEATQTLEAQNWFLGEDDPMRRLYRDKLKFFLAVREYLDFVASQDCALGMRVHGNLPALACGHAALFVNYDKRSQELAETFGIPSTTLDELTEIGFEAVYEKANFGSFNRGFPERYRIMAEFLDANGLPHRMWSIPCDTR